MLVSKFSEAYERNLEHYKKIIDEEADEVKIVKSSKGTTILFSGIQSGILFFDDLLLNCEVIESSHIFVENLMEDLGDVIPEEKLIAVMLIDKIKEMAKYLCVRQGD